MAPGSVHLAASGVEDVGAERRFGPAEARLARREQVDAAVVLEQVDVGVGARAREQRALDLAAGGVAVVEDAAVRVAALAAEVELAVPSPGVARRSKSAPSLSRASIIAGRARRRTSPRLAAEPGAGLEGVLHVGLEGVVVGEHRGDPALGPVGGRVRRLLLGDDRDGVRARRRAGRRRARDPAAEDQNVVDGGKRLPLNPSALARHRPGLRNAPEAPITRHRHA